MMKIMAVVVVAAASSAAMAQFQTVDFSGQFNVARDGDQLNNGLTFPVGNQTYLGVPFVMGAGPGDSTPWAWTADNAPGDNPRVLTVPTNVAGATAVHSLMNTFWGVEIPPFSFASITFNATGGLSYTVDLFGNSDIRDYNQNDWTNSINGTTTQEAFNNGLGQRIDMQTFVLPAAFASETLTSIVVSDTGDYGFQRMLVMGLTVQAPTPGAAAILGLGGLATFRRRR